MRKIVALIGIVVLIGVLSGCGNDYKCDSKDYAEQALNLLLFGNAEGKNDKKITLKSLGFEVGEITLMKLDKDKKSSICKANIINKSAENAIEIFKEERKTGKFPDFDDFDEATRTLLYLAQNAGADGMLSAMVGGELFKNLKIPKEEITRDTPAELLGIGAIALSLHTYGLAYRTYDNGNGDLMIEANIAK